MLPVPVHVALLGRRSSWPCRAPSRSKPLRSSSRSSRVRRAPTASCPTSSRSPKPSSDDSARFTSSQRPVDVDQPDADRGVRERRAEALLALLQRRVLLVQVDEDRDLRAQHVRVERLEQVVDRADRVAAEDLLALLVDGRQEDDRDVLGALALLDELGGLEPVQARHLDVEQDRREVLVEQPAQRLLAGGRAHRVEPERLEHRLEREQVLGLVVDEQDTRRARLGAPRDAPRISERARSPRAATTRSAGAGGDRGLAACSALGSLGVLHDRHAAAPLARARARGRRRRSRR